MRLTRRSLLVALTLAPAGAVAQRPDVLYVAPNGGGGGTSWDDPADLNDLNALLRRVGPDGEILVAADRGIYDLDAEIVVRAGGRSRRPIRVRGVNTATLEPQQAVLRGARDAEGAGHEGFRLLRGANHLHFSHLAFERFGNGCFRVGGPVNNLKIEDCAFQDVYRCLENTVSGGASNASLRRFEVRRCRGVGIERSFLRVRYASRQGLIEDCSASGVAVEAHDFPTGCVLDQRAGNITYRRCVMEGFQQVNAGAYWNGDGFSDEENNFGVIYDSCVARGSTDGGFDCKSRDVTLTRCVAEDNKRNFRIWSHRATLTDCVSRAPNFRGAGEENADACHLWAGGWLNPVVRLVRFSVQDRDGAAIFTLDDENTRVEVEGEVAMDTPNTNWGDGRVRRVGETVTTITLQ